VNTHTHTTKTEVAFARSFPFRRYPWIFNKLHAQ